jgi:hypothetical protein
MRRRVDRSGGYADGSGGEDMVIEGLRAHLWLQERIRVLLVQAQYRTVD